MYVVQVVPSREEAVTALLRDKGITVCCPVKEMQIRHGGSWGVKRCPVFTQYIFIDCEITDTIYYTVKSTPGVVRFLGGGTPKKIRSHEEEYIRWLSNGGKPIEASKVYITNEGDIMVLSGILRQYKDDMINLDLRQRRAKIRVTICGEEHRITLPVISI